MSLKFEDLDPAVARQMGLTKQRQKKFTAEHERQFALKVLGGPLSALSQAERARVLKRATQINGL